MLLKTRPLFSLHNQPANWCCNECGSVDISWNVRSWQVHIWPKDIRGHVEPTPEVVECDEFGPITTRTVRCR